MTLLPFTFALTDLKTGRLLGLGLVCPEARYASVLARRSAPIRPSSCAAGAVERVGSRPRSVADNAARSLLDDCSGAAGH